MFHIYGTVHEDFDVDLGKALTFTPSREFERLTKAMQLKGVRNMLELLEHMQTKLEEQINEEGTKSGKAGKARKAGTVGAH